MHHTAMYGIYVIMFLLRQKDLAKKHGINPTETVGFLGHCSCGFYYYILKPIDIDSRQGTTITQRARVTLYRPIFLKLNQHHVLLRQRKRGALLPSTPEVMSFESLNTVSRFMIKRSTAQALLLCGLSFCYIIQLTCILTDTWISVLCRLNP